MRYEEISPELRDALKAFEIGLLDQVVARRRPEDFAALRRLLAEDGEVSPNDRQRAMYALGKWDDPSVVPEIVARLPELKESHRITAIEALGRLGTGQARAAVEAHADDPSPHVRKFVVEALSRIGDPAAEETLRRMAREDGQEWVRNLAARRMQARAKRAPEQR
ncbi:MAG TPA: HEAT repeat domain-containing protein [Longimicrobium sp.]|nr:HEAT repeat domain-containing protein [Longimicrobium sp.]